MSHCKTCGSFAINHHLHGRDGSDPDLCDVCYWRKRAEQRKPLTRKEVLAIIDKHPAEKKTILPMFYRDQVFDIARAVERMHGIKEQP